MTPAGELPAVSPSRDARGRRVGEPQAASEPEEPADRSNPLLDAQRRALETPAAAAPLPQPSPAGPDAR